ncbi:MAG TPA: response regulator [Vicinamibacterales bacterium]|nr:response regulator [Vicinamibacterales bacterium]
MGGRETVLIVEDDPDVRRLYRAALSLAGFEIIEAQDGLSALHILDQRRADIVILDLMLPTVDGLTVQQEIAAHAGTRDIPILIVTGSTLPLDDVKVPCILRKPVSPDQLIGAVRRCLASGASGVRS